MYDEIGMGSWNNFFLQRMGVDQSDSPYPVKESVAEWGVYCKDIPFKLFDKVKDPAKRTWNDEHGDDEYIASTGLFLEAYTMKVELACKSKNAQSSVAQAAVRTNVKSFLSYLRESGMVKLYSSYTGIGRQNVRLESVSDNATWKQGDDGWWFLIFEITMKVNDPVTDWTPSSASSSS